MREYRGLVIDFGGVLTTSLGDAFQAFCEREGVDYERVRAALRAAYDQADPDSLVFRFETGRLERAAFEGGLAAILSDGLGHPVEAADLVSRMLADVRLDESMVSAVLAARRAGVRTALLSNSWGLEPYPRGLLAELFDAVIISGEVGVRKPDPRMYGLATDGLGLASERCVFVDDWAPNVEAAEAVGMRGVLHESAERTIAKLERLFGAPLDDAVGTM
jgi:epoxide hydrolase-like predicted phosphatase